MVTINDPAVFDAVAAHVFGPNADVAELRCSDLARVTRLNVTGARSLAGLEYAVNLSQLAIRNSSVSSLAPVEGLARLTTLNVTGSSLTTLHSLPALPALVALDISTNFVSDLTPLADVPGLTYLKANGNAITDISGLADLRELTWVDLSENQITDITPLAGHEQLETLLLNDNFISDAGPLSTATRLQRLGLANNALTDVDFNRDLELRTVALSGNHITYVRGVAQNRTSMAAGAWTSAATAATSRPTTRSRRTCWPSAVACAWSHSVKTACWRCRAGKAGKLTAPGAPH